MNTKRLAGIFRSLCAATLAAAFLPEPALAVSWQWSAVPQGGRERVTITLDAANQEANTSRDGTQSLRIALSPSSATLEAPQTPPAQNALVQGVSMADGALALSLSAPNFGFIASRPAANRIVVEIYRDPLGARWQPDGRLAPPTATTQTPISAPATTTPPPTVGSATDPVTMAATTAISAAPAVTQAAPHATPPPPAALIPHNPVLEAATPSVATQTPTPPTPAADAPAITSATTLADPPAATTVQIPAPTAAEISAVTPISPMPATQPAPEFDTSPPLDTPQGMPLATPQAASPADIPASSASITSPAETPAVMASSDASLPVNLTPSTPPPPQSIVLPPPVMRARLNTAGPDAWSENQILSPASASPASAGPAVPPRNRLLDIPKETAPTLDMPSHSPAPQAPLAQTPDVQVPAATQAEPNATPSTLQNPATQTPPPAIAQTPAALNPSAPPPPAALSTAVPPTTAPAATVPPMAVPTTQVAGSATTPSVNISIHVEAPASAAPLATPTPPAEQATGQPTTQVSPQTPTPATPASTVTPPLTGQTTDLTVGQTTEPIATPLAAGENAAATALATPATPLTPEASTAQANTDAPKNPDAPASPTSLPSPESPETDADKESTNPEHPDDKNATPNEKAGENADENAEAEVIIQPIYVDEQGNPVPAPPDVPALLASTRAQMNKTRFTEALPDLYILKDAELTREQREDVLYNIMKALFETSHNDLAPKAEEIHRAAHEAMNFNLDSTRVPEALNTLARIELARNNLADAEGYVMLMKRRFPHNPQVAAAMLVLGEEQMQKQNYADATITFQTILQDYPESKVAKDAARMQTYSLYRQGHMQRALTLIDFVERRWPRLYLEDPNYLTMSADIETRQNLFFDALNTYWTLYNLNPKAPEVPFTLHKIGELYYALNFPESGAKVLNELLRAFPESQESPIALLRLGENGIHDGNISLDEIFQLFEKVNPRLPGLYYQRIIQEYPDSPQVITAKLRLIAWQMWNKDTLDAMNAARSFMIDYEDKPESLRARDILLRGFAQEMGKALAEENFERVLTLWERFPQVQDYYQPLEPDLRVALARAQLNRGKEIEGMELLAPFLDGPQDPKYGQYVFNLYLASLLRQQNWDGLLSLGEKVANWALPKDTRDQLDYTLALSAENLGLQSRALPLWQKLAPKTDIPLFQRAYASYFLARDAERRQDLRGAYQYNLDALGMFTQLQDDQSPYADSERIRESIAALMDVTEIAGRFAESLDWANKYATFVPDTSPDYAGLRFREARLHRKMGDMARWRAILQGIIDKEPDSVFGKMAASELHTQDVARDLTRFTGQ